MQPQVNRINVVFLYAQELAKLRSFYEKAFDLAKPLIDAKWWVEYALGDGSHLALHQGDAAHFTGVNRQKNTVKFSIDVSDIEHFIKKLTGSARRFITVRGWNTVSTSPSSKTPKATAFGCTKKSAKNERPTFNVQRPTLK